jgi:hypothetical protein
MKILLARSYYLIVLSFIFCFFSSCNNNTDSFSSKERSIVHDGVQLMTESIAKDISLEGPIVWLRYFEKSPDFFMASDGQLVFPNIDTATNFINNKLIKMMPDIQLRWSNIRIEPLTANLASISKYATLTGQV